jgi:HK97 family phage major capsid protein
MKTCVEIREERATLIHEARATWTAAEAREGGATAEDRTAFDTAMDAADTMLARAKRLERLDAAEADLDKPAERRGKPIEEERREREGRVRDAETAEGKTRKLMAYRHWLRCGEVREDLRPEQRAASEMVSGLDAETRDTIIATASQGGYLVTPVQISDDIVAQMDNLVFVRELCRASGSITTVTSAQKLGIRQKTVRLNAADWTTEIGTVTADSNLAFGRRDLEPQQLTKLALVSIRTLMLSKDAEKEVNDDLAYQFSVAQENGFLNGSGSAQALGVFTPSASGIPTTQDVTAASATVIAGDDLINVKFSLKQMYLKGPSVSWILHRNIVKSIRKIKVSSTGGTAGDQQYVWTPGLTEGAPDRVLDIPYGISEYAPSVQTTGLYTAVLGNFRYYRIAELPQIMIQRLVELYAATGEVGFMGRHFVDGSPVLGEAFARLKMA